MANNSPFTISLSGKGFTSPRKYYSERANSINADTHITLWIDKGVIDAIESSNNDDYNAICIPGDWDSKADIKLDDELVYLLKAFGYNKVSAIIRYSDGNIMKSTPENLDQLKTQKYIKSWVVNHDQICIYYGDMIIYRGTVDKEEYDEWNRKNFLNIP